MSLKDEIKRLRAAKSLTQKQLADAIGVSQGFVGQLESDRTTSIRVETLYALSRALGVDCRHWESFFSGQPETKPAKKQRRKSS